MPTIDEKRVYTDNAGTETVFLAAELGVVAVSVSDDLIGEFGIVHRCHARDVATAGPLVAVATDEDVLLAERGERPVDGIDRDLQFTPTDFGPATAVGFDGETLLAGDDAGRVARMKVTDSNAAWTDLGTATEVRAIGGRLVAAADGVYRVGGDGLTHAGLDDARDVDAEPLVATGSGLFKLGNGWMDVLDGEVDAVDTAGPRGLAVRDGALYSRGHEGTVEEGEGDGDRSWTRSSLPVDGDVVAVAHGVEAAYAVTAEGTLAVRLPGEDWRHRGLGVRDVAAAAV